MPELSSSASLAKPNAFKFNGGTELTADFGWQMYDTPFRSYDAQLGRFHQVDPLADQAPGINPYRFGFNNPISLNDPTGLYEGNIQNIFDEAWARTPGDVGFFHFDNGKLDRDLWAEGGINYVLDFVTSGEGTAEFMMDSGGGGYWLYYNPTFVGGYIGYNNEHVGSIIQKRPLYFKTSSQNGESEFNWGIPLGLAGTATSAGIEYTENMVRTAFKTGRNPVSWSKLTPSQQAWRTTNVLGKNAKYVKYAKVAGVIGTGISVGVAMNDIVQGEGTTIDYFDVGIGGASIGAAIFLASNPVGWVIGAGAAIYFAGRLVYDIYEEVND